MANRFFQQFRYSLEKSVVDLYAVVSFGAAGAPTLDTDNNSKGIASITRTAAGTFDIVLQDSYWKFLCASAVFVTATGGPAAPTVYISAEAVDTQAGGTLTLVTQNGGSDTDPADGEVLYLQISLSNSSAI